MDVSIGPVNLPKFSVTPHGKARFSDADVEWLRSLPHVDHIWFSSGDTALIYFDDIEASEQAHQLVTQKFAKPTPAR